MSIDVSVCWWLKNAVKYYCEVPVHHLPIIKNEKFFDRSVTTWKTMESMVKGDCTIFYLAKMDF